MSVSPYVKEYEVKRFEGRTKISYMSYTVVAKTIAHVGFFVLTFIIFL